MKHFFAATVIALAAFMVAPTIASACPSYKCLTASWGCMPCKYVKAEDGLIKRSISGGTVGGPIGGKNIKALRGKIKQLKAQLAKELRRFAVAKKEAIAQSAKAAKLSKTKKK